MKTIVINEKATIKANGTHASKSHKPVICIDTGEVYVSLTDAAEHLGTTIDLVSNVCRGKQKTVKGKRFCYLSKANENLDAIITRLREASEMEAKAKMWDAMIAEQEAERKAEEKRIEDLAKAKAKQQRQLEMLERIKAKEREMTEALAATESEINNLTGKEEEVA